MPSLQKRDLRLGLTFTRVEGPISAGQGDSVNEQLGENGYNLAVQVSRISGDYLSFMEAF